MRYFLKAPADVMYNCALMHVRNARLQVRILHKTMPRLSIAFIALSIAACTNQTTVQNDYVEHRDGCQLYAESNIGNFMSPQEVSNDIRARNAKLVTLFSDCMFEQGWTVATPEREEDLAQNDDLPELNDVPAGAAAARVRTPPTPPDPRVNRRVPAQQHLR